MVGERVFSHEHVRPIHDASSESPSSLHRSSVRDAVGHITKKANYGVCLDGVDKHIMEAIESEY